MKTKIAAIAVAATLALGACSQAQNDGYTGERYQYTKIADTMWRVCDTKYGNLIYQVSGGGVAVVEGGCKVGGTP